MNLLTAAFVVIFLTSHGCIAFPGNGGKISDITINAIWKKTLDYYNRGVSTITLTNTIRTGFKKSLSSEEYSEPVNNKGVTSSVAFDYFMVLNLDVSYSYEDIEGYRQLSSEEVYEKKEITYSVTIPPKTRLIRWQLTADIAGHENDLDILLDRDDDKVPPKPSSIARIQEPKLPKVIEIGQTKVYIKHKTTGKFMNVVVIGDRTGIRLSDTVYARFTLYNSSYDSITIKTWNTVLDGNDNLSATNQAGGGVLFLKSVRNSDQYWKMAYKGKSHADLVNKLYDGVVVTFSNERQGGCYLYYSSSPADKTDVFCFGNTSNTDEWILIVAE